MKYKLINLKRINNSLGIKIALFEFNNLVLTLYMVDNQNKYIFN